MAHSLNNGTADAQERAAPLLPNDAEALKSEDVILDLSGGGAAAGAEGRSEPTCFVPPEGITVNELVKLNNLAPYDAANPAVPLTSDNSFVGSNGYRLHHREWHPAGPPGNVKAVVFWFHGIGAHVNRSTERLLSALFTAKGWALFALDFEGHGYSEGRARTYVKGNRWQTYVADADTFVRKLYAERFGHWRSPPPLFVFAESMGGAVALHLGLRYQRIASQLGKGPGVPGAPLVGGGGGGGSRGAAGERLPLAAASAYAPVLRAFRGVVTVSAAIEGDLPPKPVIWFLRYGLAPFFPRWIPCFMPHPITPERVTRDATLRESRSVDYLSNCGKPFRLGTGVMLLNLLSATQKALGDVAFPFCAVHGGADAAVPCNGSRRLFKASATRACDKRLVVVEGGYHDLLHDPLWRRAVGGVVGWIEERVNTPAFPGLQ